MSDEWIQTISDRYIELYEAVTGEAFKPEPLSEDETYQQLVDAIYKYR